MLGRCESYLQNLKLSLTTHSLTDRGRCQETLWHLKTWHGFLLVAGTDGEVKYGKTGFLWACEKGYGKIVQLLLEESEDDKKTYIESKKIDYKQLEDGNKSCMKRIRRQQKIKREKKTWV